MLLGSAGALADAQSECRDWQNTPPDRTIVVCSEVIRSDLGAFWAYTYRGIAYGSKGDLDRAIVDFNEAIELNPKYGMAYYNRGVAYGSKGDLDRAIADYSKAIEIDPKYTIAHINRGVAYKAKGDLDRAIADYSKAIEIDPKYTVAYTNRGFAYGSKGDLDRAIADYSKAIEINPKDAMVYKSRGVAYGSKGDLDRAIADYNKAIEIDPKDAETYLARGVAHFYKGNFSDASALLHAIELTDNSYAMLYRYLARSRAGEAAGPELDANAGRLKTKEWPFAVIELYLGRRTPEATLGVADKPDQRCEAQFYIGQWHVLKGNAAKAEAAFKVAVETCPKSFFEYAGAVAELKRLKR
jgi:lipoprotein NlpI